MVKKRICLPCTYLNLLKINGPNQQCPTLYSLPSPYTNLPVSEVSAKLSAEAVGELPFPTGFRAS